MILTALVCGLAILVAGGIQLFRLSDAEEIELPGLGDRRAVGGVEVIVENVGETGSLTLVAVSVQATGTGVTGPAGDGWTLLRRTTFQPVAVPEGTGTPACSEIELSPEPQECVVAFEAPGDDARFVAYRRDGVEARWALDA